MTIIDVTGKEPLVPVCPYHSGIALIPYSIPKLQGEMVGYWRCPVGHKVFREDSNTTQ